MGCITTPLASTIIALAYKPHRLGGTVEWGMSITQEEYWQVLCFRRIGLSGVDCYILRDEPTDYWKKSITEVRPSWSSSLVDEFFASTGRTDDSRRMLFKDFVATGWPFAAFYYESATTRDPIVGGIKMNSESPYTYAIPYLPLWPGIALNTLFYAGIWTSVILYLRYWVQRDRRRRGICPNCTYDLQHNVSGVCSECGHSIRRD